MGAPETAPAFASAVETTTSPVRLSGRTGEGAGSGREGVLEVFLNRVRAPTMRLKKFGMPSKMIEGNCSPRQHKG